MFKRKPETKKLEDFELIDINLIEDHPFEYGYTFKRSNRVIQKDSELALDEAIKENVGHIEYVKTKPDSDFILFKNIPKYKTYQSLIKFNKSKRELMSGLLLLVIYIAFIVPEWVPENSFWDQEHIIYLLLPLVYIVTGTIGYFKYHPSNNVE
ncbi:hypothetical protein K6119_12680 [Paracrocinitomix mangrovi]|uniref:hypothetical protein n=1 Tax=Paracrocinitomix mangrovi TaxID=2862509 RepID=UPI001C8DD16E|nr:hypothetical protein [Paracrocinitomix mangrovi]UKN00586.1 hypothetical protein K6119_12680 [Paracrocinitomix mangrovi]